MANILLITDYYPPRKSIATNRMKAFDKYLSQLGHKMFIITLGDKDSCIVDGTTTIYYCQDDDVIKRFDTNIKESAWKHYLKCVWNIVFSNMYLYSTSWVKHIVGVANEIVQNNHIDVMITSYPTIGTMVAGEKIKVKYPNIKWIMDMRDAVWSPGSSERVQDKMLCITNAVAKRCDAILAVSQPHLEKYSKMASSTTKLLVITNGYDFDVPVINRASRNGMFNIAFTGNFYGALSPHYFFIALSNLVRKRKIEDIRFKVIGNHSVLSVPGDIKLFVEEYDYMEYSNLIEYCADNIDLLMLVIPRVRERGIYTGKIFDYIGIGKPILGLVPKDDVAAELISQAGNGYIAENENVDEIEEAIYKAYMDWKNNNVPQINKDVQETYHRRIQVAKLDGLINEILNSK